MASLQQLRGSLPVPGFQWQMKVSLGIPDPKKWKKHLVVTIASWVAGWTQGLANAACDVEMSEWPSGSLFRKGFLPIIYHHGLVDLRFKKISQQVLFVVPIALDLNYYSKETISGKSHEA